MSSMNGRICAARMKAKDIAWLQVWHHAWERVGMSQFFKAALLRLAMQAEKVGQHGLEVEQLTQHTHTQGGSSDDIAAGPNGGVFVLICKRYIKLWCVYQQRT